MIIIIKLIIGVIDDLGNVIGIGIITEVLKLVSEVGSRHSLASLSKLIRQVEKGNYDVTAIYGMDEKTGDIYFQAAMLNAHDRQVYVAHKNGKVDRLTSEEGSNSAYFMVIGGATFGITRRFDCIAAASAIFCQRCIFFCAFAGSIFATHRSIETGITEKTPSSTHF